MVILLVIVAVSELPYDISTVCIAFFIIRRGDLRHTSRIACYSSSEPMSYHSSDSRCMLPSVRSHAASYME